MTGLTLAPEGSGSLVKLQPLHELLQLRSGCSRGYKCRMLKINGGEAVEIFILCKVYLVSVSHYWDTLSDTVCQFVSEVEDYSLCGYCHSLMKEGTVGEWGYCGDEAAWILFIFKMVVLRHVAINIIHIQCYATSQEDGYTTHCILRSVFREFFEHLGSFTSNSLQLLIWKSSCTGWPL